MKKIHGLATRKNRNPLFGRWKQMRQRCQNPNSQAFKNYGARGIAVCPRWERFANFIADMEGSFRDGLTLERKDNDGPYSPSNCVWATRIVQANNSRRVRMLTLGRLSMSLRHWAKKIGISENALRSRLKLGGPIKEVLTAPRGHYRKPTTNKD